MKEYRKYVGDDDFSENSIKLEELKDTSVEQIPLKKPKTHLKPSKNFDITSIMRELAEAKTPAMIEP